MFILLDLCIMTRVKVALSLLYYSLGATGMQRKLSVIAILSVYFRYFHYLVLYVIIMSHFRF